MHIPVDPHSLAAVMSYSLATLLLLSPHTHKHTQADREQRGIHKHIHTCTYILVHLPPHCSLQCQSIPSITMPSALRCLPVRASKWNFMQNHSSEISNSPHTFVSHEIFFELRVIMTFVWGLIWGQTNTRISSSSCCCYCRCVCSKVKLFVGGCICFTGWLSFVNYPDNVSKFTVLISPFALCERERDRKRANSQCW